jgi:hypothetical protein
MSVWFHHGTEVTESLVGRQGHAIHIEDTGDACRLVVNRLSGALRQLSVWGRDHEGKEVFLFEGACKSGDVIPLRSGCHDVHVAVNLVPDTPPLARRWSIRDKWYRQSQQPCRIEIEKWVAT